MVTAMLHDREVPSVQRVAAFSVAVGLSGITELELNVIAHNYFDDHLAVAALREIGARGGWRTYRHSGWHAMSDESPESRRFYTILAMGNPGEDVKYRDGVGWLGWGISHDKPWQRRAVLLALADDPLRVIQTLVDNTDSRDATERYWPWVEEMMGLVGARNVPSEPSQAIAELAQFVEARRDGDEQLADSALLHLLESLRRSDGDLTTIVAQLADEAPLAHKYVEDAFARAGLIASDHERRILPPEIPVGIDEVEAARRRGMAIRLLAFSSNDYSRQTLLTIMQSDPSQDLRLGAIAALAQHRDPSIGPLLFAEFQAQTPAIRGAILDALLADAERTRLLLDEIAAGHVAVAEIDRTRIDRLLNHPDAAIAARARELLAAALPADRQQVLADYQACLALEADPRAGREVFRKHCAQCHKIADIGTDVAPDISDSRTKTREQLLADILQPNRAIDAHYVAYAVVTADGRPLLGVIAAETATSVTLKLPEGKTETLLRADIEELRSSGVSLMPDGLEKNVPPQDMADVISFIKNWRYLDGAVPVEGVSPR
jgi:putative heme-binding domain-containing protein